MVCRTPGNSEVGPLSISRGDLDLRDLNDSYAAPALRLVTVADEDEVGEVALIDATPTYDDWQYLTRESREQRVAIGRQRRAIARRKQAKRTERAIFQVTAIAASLVAVFGCVRIMSGQHATPKAVVTVRVAPGDSLWTIASRYTPSGSATVSTVGSIRAINPNLITGAQLRVGERIQVPVQRG